jgi:hypothetical protein
MGEVRRIKKADREKDLRDEPNLPPELAEAIRQFMRKEWQRLRRDELFLLRRGMLAEVESIEKELEL